jgi:polyhydroxybutyrate depolymerase
MFAAHLSLFRSSLDDLVKKFNFLIQYPPVPGVMLGDMKTKPVLAVIFFLLAGMIQAADLQLREWSVNGAKREALVWIPDQIPSNGCPVIFVFHGHGGNMRSASRGFNFHGLWPQAAVVYMQGLPTPGKLTDPEGKLNGWNSEPDEPDNRDLIFFDAVYASLAGQIDPNRVYSTGHSNGGGFTYCLWAARGDLLAAVAPSAAVASRSARGLTPKPALHVAGTADQLVTYEWQERMMQTVRKLNGCAEAGELWDESGDLTGTLYPSASGEPFVSLTYPGGHSLPKEVPAVIVRFFKEYSVSKR